MICSIAASLYTAILEYVVNKLISIVGLHSSLVSVFVYISQLSVVPKVTCTL